MFGFLVGAGPLPRSPCKTSLNAQQFQVFFGKPYQNTLVEWNYFSHNLVMCGILTSGEGLDSTVPATLDIIEVANTVIQKHLANVLHGEGRISPATRRNLNNDQPSRG